MNEPTMDERARRYAIDVALSAMAMLLGFVGDSSPVKLFQTVLAENPGLDHLSLLQKLADSAVVSADLQDMYLSSEEGGSMDFVYASEVDGKFGQHLYLVCANGHMAGDPPSTEYELGRLLWEAVKHRQSLSVAPEQLIANCIEGMTGYREFEQVDVLPTEQDIVNDTPYFLLNEAMRWLRLKDYAEMSVESKAQKLSQIEAALNPDSGINPVLVMVDLAAWLGDFAFESRADAVGAARLVNRMHRVYDTAVNLKSHQPF